MKVKGNIVMVFILLFCLALSQNLFAQEVKFELNKDYGIKEILTGYVGKRVAIRLDGGEELEGIVSSIGDHLVHISKLSKRDFYDALVRIERINAVIIRVRSN
jgi:small nuclear ribonucleoprotein (snRNP)-like protein